MKDYLDAWWKLLRTFATFDGPLPSLAQYQFDLALHAGSALTTLLAIVLGIALVQRTVRAVWLRLALLGLLVALALLPAYLYLNAYRLGIYLLIGPVELVQLVRFFPEQLATPVTQHRLAASGMFWLVILVGLRALGSSTLSKWRWLQLGLLAALAPWPLIYTGNLAQHKWAVLQEYRTGKALFDAQCQTAGLSVHHTVDKVAGVRLGRIREDAPDMRFGDRYWSGAGIPNDRIGERYFASFLNFDFNDSDVPNAGFAIGLGTVTNIGYRTVDVPQADGSFLRWRLKGARPNQGHLQEVIDHTEAAPYVIDIASLDTPDLRKHWVAGSVMTVTDSTDARLLGTLRAFAYAPPPRKIDAALDQRSWHWALTCPPYKDIPGAMVRMATGEILKPLY